jgi:hypothetical protein
LSYFSLKDAGVIKVLRVSSKGDIIGSTALTDARLLGESFLLTLSKTADELN